MEGYTIVSFRRKYGDKKKTDTMFGKEFNKKYYTLQLELAREFYELLIRNIKQNTYGFKLAPSTLQARRLKGIQSDTPFIETGDFLNGIFIDGVSVKIKKANHHSGLKYSELYTILEFGRRDKHIKARPVFRNTIADFTPYANKKMSKLAETFIEKAMFKQRKVNIKINRG